MPIYLFQSPNGEIKEIIQSMTEKHEYSENGVSWTRLWTSPQLTVETSQVDPFDLNKATEKTSLMKGTIGDLQDFSKELSEKRKDKLGHDPVLDKYYKDYTKSRGGKAKHPDLIKQNNEKTYIVE